MTELRYSLDDSELDSYATDDVIDDADGPDSSDEDEEDSVDEDEEYEDASSHDTSGCRTSKLMKEHPKRRRIISQKEISYSSKRLNTGDGGAWCHQCKALKSNTASCSNIQPCSKKFCDVCLHKHYEEGMM